MSFFPVEVNYPFALNLFLIVSSSLIRWWICLHLPDSPLGSGECSYRGGCGNPSSPGLFFQPQEALGGSYERHGKNSRGSAQNRCQPQHAEQQGAVSHRPVDFWTLLETGGGHLPRKVRLCFTFFSCCSLGLRYMKLWHRGTSQCSASYYNANSESRGQRLYTLRLCVPFMWWKYLTKPWGNSLKFDTHSPTLEY